ncbi:hypothetical protein V8C26DRAFT_404303 [Trichoderma gracile]
MHRTPLYPSHDDENQHAVPLMQSCRVVTTPHGIRPAATLSCKSVSAEGGMLVARSSQKLPSGGGI